MDGMYRIKPMAEIINEKSAAIVRDLNEYEIAFRIGLVIAAFLVVAWILSYIFQWACSWIDDKPFNKENFLASKLNPSKYKYPVYNEGQATIDQRIESGTLGEFPVFAYSKHKKHENKSCHNINNSCYEYPIFVGFSYFSLPVLSIFLPMAILILVKVYPLTLSIGLLVSIMYVARFSRRTQKLLAKHTKDPDAHKTTEK